MKTRPFLFWFLTMLASASIHASGFRIYLQDAAAAQQGNAFTATADNPSAIYYNPAGITQLTGHNLRNGVDLVYYNFDFRSNTGQEWDSIDHLRGVAQFFYTYSPEKLPFSFGLGVYSPYGLGSKWPDDSPFRTLARRCDLMFFSFNPVIAWKVSDQLSVAAGPMLNYADLDSRRGMAVVGDEFRFRGRGFSPGFNAGLLWRPHEQHALGVNYRSPTTVDYHGHTFVRNLTPAIPGLPPSGKESASLEMPYPQHLTVGWSYRPTPAWNLEVDVHWTDWDRLNTVTIRQGAVSISEVFDWRSTFECSAGVTRHFDNGYSIGGGFAWGESASPDAHFNPFCADLAGPGFMLGLGHQGKRWSWNAAYYAYYGLPRTVSGSARSPAGQSADGRYEGVMHFVCLSMGLKF